MAIFECMMKFGVKSLILIQWNFELIKTLLTKYSKIKNLKAVSTLHFGENSTAKGRGQHKNMQIKFGPIFAFSLPTLLVRINILGWPINFKQVDFNNILKHKLQTGRF